MFSEALSSIDKCGGQLKTTKREIRDYMIWELKGMKNYKNQKFKVLKICLAYKNFTKWFFSAL